MVISVFDGLVNIVGKGEIACTSNFSFSHNVFKRLLSQTHQKVSLCGNGSTDDKLNVVQLMIYVLDKKDKSSLVGPRKPGIVRGRANPLPDD